jgi:3-oxosteroid 1-dehydrogenase
VEHSVEQAEPVIVVGGGLAGLATALGVALGGRKAVVLEASDLIGGAAAYSGGQIWCGANPIEQRLGIEDSLALAQRYVRAIGDADPSVRDEVAMIRWLTTAPVAVKYWEDVGAIRWTVIPGLADYHGEADGALAEGRYLTNELVDGNELGSWRELLRVSPYFPVGTTYADMFIKGRRLTYVDENDEIAQHAGVPAFGLPDRQASEMLATSEGADPLTFGTGVVASFLARVLKEDAISILVSHPVTALIKEGDAVVGATAAGPDGFVEFR